MEKRRESIEINASMKLEKFDGDASPEKDHPKFNLKRYSKWIIKVPLGTDKLHNCTLLVHFIQRICWK